MSEQGEQGGEVSRMRECCLGQASDGDMTATGLEAGDLHIISHEGAETAEGRQSKAGQTGQGVFVFFLPCPAQLNRSPGWTMFRRALACTSQKPPLSFPSANASANANNQRLLDCWGRASPARAA